MDSRGRAIDGIYIERLWRSVEQEYVCKTPCRIVDFYNNRHPHQNLDHQCHATVYMRKRVA